MRLPVDRLLGKIVLGPGTTQEVTIIEQKRTAAAEFVVQFLENITPVELPSDASGIFEIKPLGNYDVAPLAAALAWVKTGTGEDTLYKLTVNLIKPPLNALLGISDAVPFTVVAATDLFTSAASPPIGAIIQYASDDTLPAGLEPNQDYHVLTAGHTATDWKVSLTAEGTPVNVTDAGTGTHTWTRLDNDIVFVDLMAELQWVADGKTNKSQTITFRLVNDVVRAGDVPPSSPPLVYGLFLPEINSMADFKAVPTEGRRADSIVGILIDVLGTRTLLWYRLVSGPAVDPEPADVEPNDYDAGTNDVHWEGAAGPSGPAGVSAGLPYKWNTSTAATDPTAGKVKVNNATLANATELYLSETDDDGNSLGALFATWDDGTSTVRGQLIVSDPATPANFAIFNLTGTRTDNGAWDTFLITPITSGGALTNNLPVQLFFIPKGDKGDTGATGSPGGIAFTWSTDTTASDPTTGKLKINNAALASATALYISETDSAGNALAAYLATLDDGTSTIRGRFILADPLTPTNFAIYDVSGTITDNGTWDTFTIAHVASGGAFTDGLALRLFFTPKGDKGDTGTTGTPAGIGYLWDTGTGATDPTSGKLKINNAALASATALYISETDSAGNALAAYLATFDDGTSTVKGRILLRDPVTPTNFAIYDVTGTITDNGTWDTFTIAHVASGGTFTNDLALRLIFIPKGDKGDTGPTELAQNTQNAAYTFVLDDAGKHIFHDEATARVYTIPANGSVAYPVGTTITIVNNAGAGIITLSITTDTLRRGDGTAGTGSRTIPASGIVTVLKTKTTEWMATGALS